MRRWKLRGTVSPPGDEISHVTQGVAFQIALALTTLVCFGVARVGASPLDDRPNEDAVRPAAIVVGRYVAPDGTLRPATSIVLSKGKIEKLTPSSEIEGDDAVVAYPDAVACPGLIDARSTIGAGTNLGEGAYAIDSKAGAIDLLNRGHRDFSSALRAGITTVVLVPPDSNLVGGAAAVVKTATPEDDGVLRSDGPLMFSLSSRVRQYDRAPTSMMGSLAMLRGALEAARASHGDSRLKAFASGSLDGMVVCDNPIDVSAALRTFAAFDGRIAIVQTGETQEVVEEIAASKRAVVVGPFDFNMSPRTLTSAGALSAAGITVAFAGDMPRHNALALRVTGALAVRYGMEPAAARRAMTIAAADVAGVGNRVGAIAAKRDADLVIFSDDPLRLDAKVLAVYVDGVRVYDAKLNSTASGGER